jgi:hypothetical protein
MNEILKEVREAKQRVNAHFDHDVHKYCVDVIRRQEELKKQGVKFLRLNNKQKLNSDCPETDDMDE